VRGEVAAASPGPPSAASCPARPAGSGRRRDARSRSVDDPFNRGSGDWTGGRPLAGPPGGDRLNLAASKQTAGVGAESRESIMTGMGVLTLLSPAAGTGKSQLAEHGSAAGHVRWGGWGSNPRPADYEKHARPQHALDQQRCPAWMPGAHTRHREFHGPRSTPRSTLGDPDNGPRALSLGICAIRTCTRAELRCEQVSTSDRDPVHLIEERAQELLEAEDVPAAREVTEEALRGSPDRPELLAPCRRGVC
jgi:hypothetical protein